MTAPTPRMGAPQPPEGPILHDLPSFRGPRGPVRVQVVLRRDPAGGWRGRLRFSEGEDATLRARETAEIFCAATEHDLWQSVYGLREHHIRDLHRATDQS
jgi:hypothetical protein